jgi:hypothetical protein
MDGAGAGQFDQLLVTGLANFKGGGVEIVPEPDSFALLALGLVAVATAGRRGVFRGLRARPAPAA